MKKKLLILFNLLIILISCEKKEIKLIPKNHLLEFNKSEVQVYELDTLENFEIVGKKGTKIRFNRKSFNIPENQKITAELTELYNFNDILFNNINTLTNKNEFLETSGVIKIEFKSNNRILKLNENSKLIIEFPNNLLKNNNLFTGNFNEFNQVKWKKEEQTDTLFSISKRVGVWVQRLITKDSISYYKKQNLRVTGYETIQEVLVDLKLLNSIGIFKNLGWINIDKIITPDYRLTFELKTKNEKIENLSVYFTYENLNSFISYYRTIDNLVFEEVPIKNLTKILVIGEYENNLFTDNIILNKIKNKEKVELNLKQISKEELKRKFKN